MMTIENLEKYRTFQARERKEKPAADKELWLLILLFGSMGAITWAIRGTAGWGGVDGTVVPGLTWGLLWYYYCHRIGIDARGIVFFLGFGIALGGELGYGQYTGWILGKFSVGNDIIAIDPFIGYLWLFICGIGWAAPGGIMLGWALGRKSPGAYWVLRGLLMIILLIFLFAWPLMEWIAAKMVSFWPGLLFPNAAQGIYEGNLDAHLERTIYTNTQNFAVLCWWISALLLAAVQRDRITLKIGLILGLGFGIGFMQSGAWCLGYGYAPDYIDWWKLWELNAGFNLGLLYAILLYGTVYNFDRKNISDSTGSEVTGLEGPGKTSDEVLQTIVVAISGSILIYFMGFEYFFWPGLVVSLLFLGTLLYTILPLAGNLSGNTIRERRLNILLIFSFFILVFLMIHGGSERAGFILGLYPLEAVDQYAWPFERIVLALPFFILLLIFTFYHMRSVLFYKNGIYSFWKDDNSISMWMVDLMTSLGFVGALSIWPAKIGVIYALMLMTALYAFNRLNRRLQDF